MSKLTLDILKERSESAVSEDLLNSISGGTEHSCHPNPPKEKEGVDAFIEWLLF